MMQALIPLSPDALGGPSVAVEADRFVVLARREKAVLVEFHELPDGVGWFGAFELMYGQAQRDGETIKVIRTATDEERVRFRVPLWIQGEDVPECCGGPMVFVGQLDDHRLCAEPPAGATMWWHDQASFYVFTCSHCLACKAVGQQM